MSTQPDDHDRAYLWDMRQAALDAFGVVEGLTFSQFETSSLHRLAIERLIEIVGEAARRVSVTFQAAHPEIPWRDIIGQRNVLAHDYGDIDPRRLWQAATVETHQLVEAIDRLIPPSATS